MINGTRLNAELHLSLISGVPVMLTAQNIFCFEIRKKLKIEDNDHTVYIYSIEVNRLAGLDAQN